ncbi:MAG TPA: META domain-containing protein [Chitinophagaceae bacterium]|nr:META domain-containing protein [Chitinophagaceae bacterium]
MKKIIISAISIILASSAGKGQPLSGDSSLYEKKWYLKKIHLPVGNDLPAFKTDELTGKTAFIIFHKVKKSAGGNGGCNTFGGSLLVKGDKISIRNIIATQMYCEGVQQTENDFFSALRKVNRFEIKNKKLLLYEDKIPLLELENE